MSKPRSVLTIVAGWLCVVFAIIMILFCVLMFLLEVPMGICLGIGATSLFPILIAVACLVPSKRTMALSVIGGVLCAGCVGGLIMSFVNPPPEQVARSPRVEPSSRSLLPVR